MKMRSEVHFILLLLKPISLDLTDYKQLASALCRVVGRLSSLIRFPSYKVVRSSKPFCFASPSLYMLLTSLSAQGRARLFSGSTALIRPNRVGVSDVSAH
jgi:hypothetical protein